LIDEFDLSNTQFGLVNSAFLFAYAIGHLIAGPFIDRYGTKRAFGVAVVAWSVAGMLHAAARGFVGLVGLRALLGLTEAANFPAALKAVAEWFPRAERSLAVGVVTVGPGLGAVIAPPMLGWLTTSFGWQAAFLVPGAVGFLWLILWRAWYALPEQHSGLTAAERDLILTDRDEQQRPAQPIGFAEFAGLLRRREMWGLVLSRFVNDGGFYFFVAWLPTYLDQARGFSIREIAAFAWVPFLAADVGSLAGGLVSRRLVAAGFSLDVARKWPIWAGAIMIPLTLPAVSVESSAVAIALIAIAMFAIQFKAANLFALPVDLFPPRQVGTVWGLFGAVGSLGGMVFVAVVGWVSEHYSYLPVFFGVAVTQFLSALLVSWLIPRIGPLVGKPG